MINLKWLLQHDQTVRCTFLSYYLMTNILKEKLGFQLYFEILTSLTILESSNFPYVFFKTNFKMSVIYGLPLTQIWIKIGYSKDSNRHPSTPYCRGGCFLLCFLLKHSPYIQSPVHGISNTQQVQGFLCLTWQPQLLRGGSLQEMMSLQEMISYCSP